MTKEEAKHLSEVLKAYSEGKEIEHLRTDKVWECVCEDPAFTEGPMRYRIKPEPKYRPYNGAEEFFKAQKEHGPFIKSDLGMMREYYSVRVIHTRSEGVTLNMSGARVEELNYKELLEKHYWQDGAPCGILEEN